MPTLKKEMFMRPNRMTHRFGEKDDPIQSGEYFEAPYPNGIKSVNMNGKGRFSGKTKGLRVYTPPFSGVDKAKGGLASFSGPAMDIADEISDPVPASTLMRRTEGPMNHRRKNAKEK